MLEVRGCLDELRPHSHHPQAHMSKTISIEKLKVGQRFSWIPAAWYGPAKLTEKTQQYYDGEKCWDLVFDAPVVNPPGREYGVRGSTRVYLLRAFGFRGNKDHPLYCTWQMMNTRCSNKNFPHYINYGGRGIQVCERWRDFWNFVEDMVEKPTSKHTLERRDNDGNYEPSNCCWATRKEQAINTRVCIKITHNGETKTAEEWAAVVGLASSRNFRSRLTRYPNNPEKWFLPKAANQGFPKDINKLRWPNGPKGKGVLA